MKKMNFVWDMTEENWKELIENNNKKDDVSFNKSDNMYGQCFIGGLCAEILHTHDDSDWYAYANVYGLGINDGYAKTEDGTPYALLDDGPALPMKEASFKEFKTEFERLFEEYINTDEQRVELAVMPLRKW